MSARKSKPAAPNLCILGAGHVGLVSAAGFAARAFDVVCADIDADRIARLGDGELPFYEPDLDEQVRAGSRSGRLRFSSDVAASVAAADVVFIAVGTPPQADGRADISQVMAAARMIADALRGETVIAVKSTVPVGTGRRLERLLREHAPKASVAIASVPEFLREGSAVRDFAAPDRIVIGAGDARTRETMARIYAGFAENGTPIVMMDIETAELVKYAANAYLAAKVGYINEMANLCDALGADIEHLARALGADRRIGPAFLRPGPGYGGSCFPKDTAALAATAHEAGAPVRIVESVITSNEHHVRSLAHRMIGAFETAWRGKGGKPGPGKRAIAVLGLSFKANTDDMRWSASLVVIPALAAKGFDVRAYDPRVRDASAAIPQAAFCASAADALDGADAAVILTEWEEFKTLDWAALKLAMRAPVLFDARNLCDPAHMRALGFSYHSLGRK